MLLDRLTNMSDAASLTGIAAGATGFSDVIDITNPRDLGPQNIPLTVIFDTVPTSATAGATFNAALQYSLDNVTWATLAETAPQPLSNFTAINPWLWRGTVPKGQVYRYLRMAYTPSAVLTAGAISASIGGASPRRRTYAKNYVA